MEWTEKNGCAIYFSMHRNSREAFTATPYRRYMHTLLRRQKNPALHYTILRPANECSTIKCLLRMEAETRTWQPGTILTVLTMVLSPLPGCYCYDVMCRDGYAIADTKTADVVLSNWLRKLFINSGNLASSRHILWTDNKNTIRSITYE